MENLKAVELTVAHRWDPLQILQNTLLNYWWKSHLGKTKQKASVALQSYVIKAKADKYKYAVSQLFINRFWWNFVCRNISDLPESKQSFSKVTKAARPKATRPSRPALKIFQNNFLSILGICKWIAPIFEGWSSHYHWSYVNCQLWNG